VADKIITPIPTTKIVAMRYAEEVLLTLGAEVDSVSASSEQYHPQMSTHFRKIDPLLPNNSELYPLLSKTH
jgi:hypothetical protein